MSSGKAILIVDIPSNCSECPFCRSNNDCIFLGSIIFDDSVDLRCPLIHLTKTDLQVLEHDLEIEN